jgi:hypothetical protein
MSYKTFKIVVWKCINEIETTWEKILAHPVYYENFESKEKPKFHKFSIEA